MFQKDSIKLTVTIFFAIALTTLVAWVYSISNLPLGFFILALFKVTVLTFAVFAIPFGLLILLGKLMGILARPIELMFESKSRCRTCSQPARDDLTHGKETFKFCRMHLVDTYSEHFLASPYKMIVVEFMPTTTSSTGAVYGYHPLSEMQKYGWSKKNQEVLEQLIKTIEGNKCFRCSKNASVLFIPKEKAPWERFGPNPSPEYEKLGIYCCREHALERVIPSIRTNPKRFNDGGGLYIPYEEDGFQVTTEL